MSTKLDRRYAENIKARPSAINHKRKASFMDNQKPELNLRDVDGNAFVLLGKARRVAKENDMDWEKIRAEATTGDYDHLLQTLMSYFEVVV